MASGRVHGGSVKRPLGALARDHDPPPVVLVGEMTARERKHDHRSYLGQSHHSQSQNGVSAQPQFPGNGEGEHLPAEAAEETADDEEAEVPDAQDGVRVAPRGRESLVVEGG